MITTILESLATHPLVIAIGWTLIHFVWQAALVGTAIFLVLGLMRQSSAGLRYGVACAGLAVMACAPLATLACLVAASNAADWQTQSVAAADMSSPTVRDSGFSYVNIDVEFAQQSGIWSAQQPVENAVSRRAAETVDDTVTGSSVNWPATLRAVGSAMQPWLPLCVMIWMAGVWFLAIRMLFGLQRVWLWKREGVDVAGGESWATVLRLSKRMNLRQRVRLLETARDAVPAVIGWIRPAILVPTSMLSGLTTAELESILAHELAHVRRYDYLVNLLQTVVETVLFYHPAVWWLSNRIRAERENCCDDIAVAVCGNRVVFARALSRMEELRCAQERLSVAANGASLLTRIRRIVSPEPASAGPWWPAGAIVLGSLGLLLGGLWMSTLNASPVETTGSQLLGDHESNVAEPEMAEETVKIETRKSESVVTDSKTGIEQRVFPGIKVRANSENEMREASLSMKYTNVMAYSFIPARIAKQLGAVELGQIDFGTQPSRKEQPFQAMLELNVEGLQKIATEVDSEPQKPKPEHATHVNELTEPVDNNTKIVPYLDDAVWIPGHLGFYGMNQTNQHRFKIVRIEKAALGVGPEFGPVNALVLDDENSDFGLLGMDWIQQVRGKNGEGLWFVAGEGALYFTAGTVNSGEANARDDNARDDNSTQAPADQLPGSVTVESHGHDEGPARIDRPGVKVLATHTYPRDKRTSTGWVESGGGQLPVDVGVEFDGITVYQTLMYDIIAVDSKTEKSIWKMDWGKTMPMWQTVSIVELDKDGAKELAVELYAAIQKTGALDYTYLSLKTGEKLEPPTISAADSGQQQDSNSESALQLNIKPVERDGDRITRATVNAFDQGRSATELVRHFAVGMPGRNIFQAGSSTTNMESIVSASQPNYLLEDRMEAPEVLFNLPEGSGLHAEFSGKNVEIKPGDKTTTVIVTEGKLELIDAGGVIRALASPDGGAEQLVIVCREDLGEVVMKLKTRRIKESPDYPNPPVQVVMNTNTGAPKDEGDPPHGAIRYEIQKGEDGGRPIVRMKMKWRYEMKRLLEEAQAESGLSAEELIYGKQGDTPTSIPVPHPPVRQTEVSQRISVDETPWGELAQDSGLRSRLTLITETPIVGQPLLFKLEIKNFAEKPTGVDAQNYEPFRVLRAIQSDGKSAKFIGLTPQTSGKEQQLEPGESMTLWENVDANGLFLLEAGRYKFYAEGGKWATQTMWRDSNTLFFEIAAGEQKPFLKKLVEGLPEKWEVSSGIWVPGGWQGIFLTHLPTNLKRDATSIQIWFTDEKLADDFKLGSGDQQQVVSQLGRCEFGFMNVAALPKANDIWPGYLEHIRNAAATALAMNSDGGNGKFEKFVEAARDFLPPQWKVTSEKNRVFMNYKNAATVRLSFFETPQREVDHISGGGDDEKVLVLGRCDFGYAYAVVPSRILDQLRPAIMPVANLLPNRTVWMAFGRVTNGLTNKPVEGATVRAHCGAGTLRLTGETKTDSSGRYQLHFGPGMWSENESFVQAATISVHLDGHFEKNLHRQGDLVAAMKLPADGNIGWGGKTADEVFLPDTRKTIDFVMLPATKISGVVTAEDGNQLEGVRVSLVGEHMPPSSSVVANTRTDKEGRFELNEIPTGFKYQILIEPAEAKSPWLAWASAPMEFLPSDNGGTHIKYSMNGKRVDFSCQQLMIMLHGAGKNWKTAVKDAAQQELKLKWDGLATDTMVRAGTAFLELGAN